MNWLIISMLKLSKLDAGVVKLEEKEFSLAPVIREALKNLEVLAELKGVEISCELLKQREKEITLYGDEAWNREAIQNVLKNAIEHSKENTPVTIRVEDNSVYTAVTITNEGKPISKEMQKQIFSRHYSAADAGENNMGIGLPLAKAILEKQNGYLTVESTQEKTSFILKYLKQRNQMSS
jgi:signal transduction histidine kinase